MATECLQDEYIDTYGNTWTRREQGITWANRNGPSDFIYIKLDGKWQRCDLRDSTGFIEVAPYTSVLANAWSALKGSDKDLSTTELTHEQAFMLRMATTPITRYLEQRGNLEVLGLIERTRLPPHVTPKGVEVLALYDAKRDAELVALVRAAYVEGAEAAHKGYVSWESSNAKNRVELYLEGLKDALREETEKTKTAE